MSPCLLWRMQMTQMMIQGLLLQCIYLVLARLDTSITGSAISQTMILYTCSYNELKTQLTLQPPLAGCWCACGVQAV